MSAYVIADVEVTDPSVYDEYRKQVGATITRYGGRFAVRGGDCRVCEGDWRPSRVVVLEFPSLEHANRWYDSPEYRPLIALRERSTRSKLLIVDGVAS